MAEWLKALVLKTRDRKIRRFESCPFRQNNDSKACFASGILKVGPRIFYPVPSAKAFVSLLIWHRRHLSSAPAFVEKAKASFRFSPHLAP